MVGGAAKNLPKWQQGQLKYSDELIEVWPTWSKQMETAVSD